MDTSFRAKVGKFMGKENKIKHLEFIQGVINRMGSNSFMLKGWAVTLVSGIFVLAGKDTNQLYFLAAYVPVVTFWALDSYYLLQERSYRALYDRVRTLKEDEIDFSLNSMSENPGVEIESFTKCMFSNTEIGFYGPLAIICTAVVTLASIL